MIQPTIHLQPRVLPYAPLPSQHPRRILAVDDDEVNREVLAAMLRKLGYEFILADCGTKALELLNPSIDLVLLDIMMPGMDGFAVASAIRERPECRDLPIIMVTSLSEKSERLRAVKAGAADFINKPIDITELQVRLAAHMERKEALDALKLHKSELEYMVEQRTMALRDSLNEVTRLKEEMSGAYLETLYCLSTSMEFKDSETSEHIQRMSLCSALLGRKAGLSEAMVEQLLHAAPLHDVGKIGIPDIILLKPGKLNPEEWEIMKTHTTIGGKILEHSKSEVLRAGAIIALTHHEKWDGTGYPSGLKNVQIPLTGRICAIADVFDALLSARPYKPAFSPEKAVEIMMSQRGKHFDPDLLDLFMGSFAEFLAINRSNPNSHR